MALLQQQWYISSYIIVGVLAALVIGGAIAFGLGYWFGWNNARQLARTKRKSEPAWADTDLEKAHD